MTPEQLSLLTASPVDAQIVTCQPSIVRAIVVCADMAGLEDKQAAHAAGVDPATWSRIKQGQANFPVDRLREYQAVCGNLLPLQWLARECGYDLVPLETELERQLRLEREEKQRLEQENKLLRSLVVGRAV